MKQKVVPNCTRCNEVNGKTRSDQNNDDVVKNDTAISIKPKFNIHKIDVAAFAVGGLLFILFNVIYWTTFLNFNFN